ncbi:MAG: tetratricopeptide repeat protein [Mariniblastus sp.]
MKNIKQRNRKRQLTLHLAILSILFYSGINASAQDGVEPSATPVLPVLTDPIESLGSPPADFEERNRDRIDTINRRIRRIRMLIEEEKAAALEAESKTDAKQNKNANVDPPAVSVDPNQKVPDSNNQTDDSPAEQTETEISESASVVAGLVNPVELGHSLFLTGNFAASRKHFEMQLKQAKDLDPEEAAWLRCLVGCCFRMEGQYQKAEEMFRATTRYRVRSYATDYAKWNLGYLQKRRQTFEAYQAVEQEINAILKGEK